MRVLIQRVQKAQVSVEDRVVGAINKGYLLFLGFKQEDNAQLVERMWQKIYNLRLFEDTAGKTNLSLADVAGELLLVSQFTLYANCKKGNRPSFIEAAKGEQANALYEQFITLAKAKVAHVEKGIFGADMQVSLLNDGPFTVYLDSDEIFPQL